MRAAARVGSALALLLACGGEGRSREPELATSRAAPAAAPVVEARAPAPASAATWGGLDVALRGEGATAIVLLHGYGGSGDDMLPVAEALAAALPVRVAVPTSPRAWMHGGGGRAWFERTADDADAQVTRAAAEVEAVRAGLVAEGRAASDVVLAGFSQGASLALETALRATEPPRALVFFSGRVLDRFAGRWGALAGVPVFVSHGRGDPLIPFHDGERAAERAAGAGAVVTVALFEGGHELPLEIVERASAFLAPLVAASD